MSESLRNFVNGRSVDAHGANLDLIDPATGAVDGSLTISSSDDVDIAVSAAERAFQGWRDTTPAQRQRALLRLADAVERHADELADLESRDTGKPRASLIADEIDPAADVLRFFAGAARNLEGISGGEYVEGFTSHVRREPIGVIAQITPWNYPLMMAVWKIAPAIAAGNTVVLKPSETTPRSTIRLAELAAEYLPAGVFNVVIGDGTTGALLVDHPTPQLAAITGSVRAGIQVAESAAGQVKRVHLELGGKAPAIVFADADLDGAAEGIAVAAFGNAGQDCTAATRVIVHESVHDEFVDRLVKYVEDEIRTGPADSPDSFYGPLNSADHFAKVRGFLERLPDHAAIMTGGSRVGMTGFFLQPTIVTDVRQDDEIVQEEVFGPVLTVQRFSDEETAIDLANGVAYALSSSVWTRDHGRALRFTRELEFGCVWINTHILLAPEMPHGGFKRSGYGKDLSSYGFEDYTRIKHVMSSLG